ncbi:MAG: hypothetical protein ACRDTH_04015 [Pseudonocardiaceae bacterium]
MRFQPGLPTRKPDVEVELVERTSSASPRVLKSRIAAQRHTGSLLAAEWLLLRWDTGDVRDVLNAKLRVVVEVAGEVQAPESRAVAVAEKACQRQRRLGRLRRI